MRAKCRFFLCVYVSKRDIVFTFLPCLDFLNAVSLRRRLLRLVRAPDQVRGLLREVPAAAHALPVLAGVHLPVQLQPAERRRLGGREQRSRVPPAEGAAGIAPRRSEQRSVHHWDRRSSRVKPCLRTNKHGGLPVY